MRVFRPRETATRGVAMHAIPCQRYHYCLLLNRVGTGITLPRITEESKKNNGSQLQATKQL